MDNELNDPVSLVNTWPKLPGPSKAAWRYIWEKAGRRPKTIRVTFAEIVKEQGTSESAGRRCITTLKRHGLIRIVEEPPNAVLIFIWDPREVDRPQHEKDQVSARPLLLDHSAMEADNATPEGNEDPPRRGGSVSDPKRPANEEQNGSETVPKSKPRNRRENEVFGSEPKRIRNGSENSRPLTFEQAHAHPPLPFNTFTFGTKGLPTDSASATSRNGSETVPQPIDVEQATLTRMLADARASAGVCLESPPTEQPIANAVQVRAAQALATLPGDARQMRAVEDLADRIFKRVGDRELRLCPRMRVARAVVEGVLPVEVLESIYASLEAAIKLDPTMLTRPRARMAYFVVSARREFERRSLPWPVPDKKVAREPWQAKL